VAQKLQSVHTVRRIGRGFSLPLEVEREKGGIARFARISTAREAYRPAQGSFGTLASRDL
jgi:hypothetical protein